MDSDDNNEDILRVKEALHMMLAGTQTLLNRDQGTIISNCWKTMLPLAMATNLASAVDSHTGRVSKSSSSLLGLSQLC